MGKLGVRDVNWNFSYNNFCIKQLPLPYCANLIMVTITANVFIYIFQKQCFSTVKFDMGYEKNYALSFDTKILIKVWKKKWKRSARTGFYEFINIYFMWETQVAIRNQAWILCGSKEHCSQDMTRKSYKIITLVWSFHCSWGRKSFDLPQSKIEPK